MAEVVYNQPWSSVQSAGLPQIPEDNQSFPDEPKKKRRIILGALIILILCLILLSLYLAFGRSVTKPVSPDLIKRALPSGPPFISQ